MVDRLLGRKVIGIKQSTKAIKSETGKTLYVAKDAEEQMTRPVVDLAVEKGIEVVYINTMKDLGKLCGIDVGAAVTLILKE